MLSNQYTHWYDVQVDIDSLKRNYLKYSPHDTGEGSSADQEYKHKLAELEALADKLFEEQKARVLARKAADGLNRKG